MSYRYDIFVSYRRHPAWTPWTREHIHDLLDTYLTQDLGSRPAIFIDERIEPGADWPNRLGESLAQARVLLPVFSGDYFSSDWCLHELDLMHGRLLHSPGTTLIVPVVGHDGDLIPIEIARLQPVDFKEFRNPDLQRRTPRYERFADAVGQLTPHLAQAIRTAPPFDPAWVTECCERFDRVYNAHCGGPDVPVETLTLKPVPVPVTPPRVTP